MAEKIQPANDIDEAVATLRRMTERARRAAATIHPPPAPVEKDDVLSAISAAASQAVRDVAELTPLEMYLRLVGEGVVKAAVCSKRTVKRREQARNDKRGDRETFRAKVIPKLGREYADADADRRDAILEQCCARAGILRSKRTIQRWIRDLRAEGIELPRLRAPRAQRHRRS